MIICVDEILHFDTGSAWPYAIYIGSAGHTCNYIQCRVSVLNQLSNTDGYHDIAAMPFQPSMDLADLLEKMFGS